MESHMNFNVLYFQDCIDLDTNYDFGQIKKMYHADIKVESNVIHAIFNHSEIHFFKNQNHAMCTQSLLINDITKYKLTTDVKKFEDY
jgi:hypothetical protein